MDDGATESATEQWEANRRALEADRRAIPNSRSWFEALRCRVFGHEWDAHEYHADGEAYEAVTCRLCEEIRMLSFAASGENTNQEETENHDNE